MFWSAAAGCRFAVVMYHHHGYFDLMQSQTPEPAALIATLLAMCALNLTGYLFVRWGTEHALVDVVFGTIFILAGYFVLSFYWTGQNWARILVILTSLLSVYSLVLLRKHQIVFAKAAIICEAILGIYLIYWLNTAEAKNFFASRSSASSPV